MVPQTSRVRAFGTLALASVIVIPPGTLTAQESKCSATDASTERRAEMKGLVQPMRAVQIKDGQRIPLEIRPEPLQRWNDPTREFSDGSLWLWTARGRPVAAVAVELYPSRTHGQAWSFELVSLTTDL